MIENFFKIKNKKGVIIINIFLDIDDTMVDYDVVEKNDSYKNIPPFPGVVQFIQKCIQKGDTIYIISWYNKDSPDRVKEKYQWCLTYLPMIEYSNIAVIPAPSNKAKQAQKMLGAALSKNDMLIDDMPENIKDWREAGGNPFLFDKKTMSWKSF